MRGLNRSYRAQSRHLAANPSHDFARDERVWGGSRMTLILDHEAVGFVMIAISVGDEA